MCPAPRLGYDYERNITINSSQVAGGSDLHNFPVMIRLTGQDFLRTHPNGNVLSPDGYDIIFTDEAYGKLDHQIEYYNGTTGDLTAWVRIPVLSASANTVIKVLYGNPAITSSQSVASVWDSHYRGVWHLNGTPLGDATGFDYTGTPYNNPTYTAGAITNAMTLNGSNQYMQVNNAPHLNFTGNITVSAWIRLNATGRDQKIAGNQVGSSGGGYKFGIYTNNKLEFEVRNSSGTPTLNRDVAGGTVLTTNNWYYVAGVSSDVIDSIMTYVNGVRERPFKKNGTLAPGSNTMVSGKEPFENNYYFNGRIDELRISDNVRSGGWLRTEYNNQSSPSAFYTVSATEENAGFLPSQGICNTPITLSFGSPAGGTYSGPYVSGDQFNPPAPGTYAITYYGSCGTASVTKQIIITPLPDPPLAPDVEICRSQIASLKAEGENIRWYYNGNLVSTANPYSPGISTPGTYAYTVTQTVNGCESNPSTVSLYIYSGATITAQPQSQSVCEGDNALFSVTASGYNLSYQWQRGTVNISNGLQYSGVNTPTLTILSPTAALNGNYRCVVTTTCGTGATSSPAALTVVAPPVATFSYPGSPYCPNATNPDPTFSGGGIAGTFSSTPGLVFVSTSTGRINIAASTPGIYTVTNTVTGTGPCGSQTIVATSVVEITSTVTWTGNFSTNWNTASNWSCNYIPTARVSVRIPNVARKPVINTGSVAEVKDITIDQGAALRVAGNTLTITGTVSASSSIDATAGTVVFAGTTSQTIPAGLFTGNTIMNLTAGNPAGVTLAGPLNVSGVLNVTSGTLNSAGHLTLLSTPSGTALIDGSGAGEVTGDVTMQRYLPSGFGYKYFSSPFIDALVNQFGDDMDLTSSFPLFYRYNEDSPYAGWESYTHGSSPLNPLEGYAVNFGSSHDPKTVDVTGTVNNGPLSITLHNHNRTYTRGFNLVGNPYPSPINWNAPGWTRHNIDDAIYLFRASATDQYGGQYSSYIRGVSSDGEVTNVIASMQGFLVHVSDGTYPVTGTLGLTNSVRLNGTTIPFMKSAMSDMRTVIRATAGFTDDNASYDPLVIYFDNGADTTFNSRYDALKLYNTDMRLTNFYSVLSDGEILSIRALPVQTDSLLAVPLGLYIFRNGEVRFTLRDVENLPPDLNIYFRDAVTGINTPIHPSGEYTVPLTAGGYNSRFSIVFHKSLTAIETPVESSGLFNAYAVQGRVRTEIFKVVADAGTITVHTTDGRLIHLERIADTGICDLKAELKPGVYLVSYSTGGRKETKKLVVGIR